MRVIPEDITMLIGSNHLQNNHTFKYLSLYLIHAYTVIMSII